MKAKKKSAHCTLHAEWCQTKNYILIHLYHKRVFLWKLKHDI